MELDTRNALIWSRKLDLLSLLFIFLCTVTTPSLFDSLHQSTIKSSSLDVFRSTLSSNKFCSFCSFGDLLAHKLISSNSHKSSKTNTYSHHQKGSQA